MSSYAEIDGATVFFDDDLVGVVEVQVKERGGLKHMTWKKAQDWLDAHDQIKAKAEAELAAKRKRVKEWKEAHWVGSYSADRGCFRVRAGGVVIDLGNRGGDCMAAPVYVVPKSETSVPAEFHYVAGVKGKVELLNYDIDGEDVGVVAVVEDPEIMMGSGGGVVVMEGRA